MKILDKIKEKQLFGVIIETGAGNVVYNELCKHPNTASKIVYYAESPNNWTYNKFKYKHPENIRAISPEICQNIIRYEFEKNNFDKDYSNPDLPEINFILTNTIQISNDPKTTTHGWFGLYSKTSYIKYYHFTLNNFTLGRKEALAIISEIGLNILQANNNISELTTNHIDMILDSDLRQNLNDTLAVQFQISNELAIEQYEEKPDVVKDNCFVIRNGKILRLNDYLRTVDEITIFKGSFNPIHPQHIDIINAAKEKGLKNIILNISLHNFNNKNISLPNLLSRIELLNSLGYDVLINHPGYYHYIYTFLRSHPDFKDKKINFLLGQDILNQVIMYDCFEMCPVNNLTDPAYAIDIRNQIKKFVDLFKCKFYYTRRNLLQHVDFNLSHLLPLFTNMEQLSDKIMDVSSTDVRRLLEDNNLDELAKLVGNDLTIAYKILKLK